MADRTPTDDVIDKFNSKDFSGAASALKILQEQDSKDEPQQWQRHIAAVNANVDLQKLGVKDGGQIVGTTPGGELITVDRLGSHKQVRAANDDLTIKQQLDLYSGGRGDMMGIPVSNDRKTNAQVEAVQQLQKEAETARLPKLGPGDHQLSITVEGQQREYDVHVPPNAEGKQLPVYYALHGAGPMDAPKGEMASEMGLNELADKRGFIVVYPYAATHEQTVTGPLTIAGMTFDLKDQHISYHSWNSPGAGMNTTRGDYDDINYLKAVRDNVARQLNTDPTRNYYIGFSEGAEFLNKVAAHLPAAGIASIHGTLLGTETAPNRPTAFISVTSELDGILRRDGSAGKFNHFYPRLNTSEPTQQFERWKIANGCGGHVDAQLTPESQTLAFKAAQCASRRPVVDINRFQGRHTIDGHYTIGSAVAALIGESKDHSFDAARVAVDFLEKQRLYQ
jgi:poly(3-hydroxybutyrate) depolymerase